MSFQAMTWATEHRLKSTPKIVLVMLANRCNHETGRCFPSIDLLAEECGLGRSTVQRTIAELADMGLLEVIPRFANGVQQANAYRLNLENRGTLGMGRAPLRDPRAPERGGEGPAAGPKPGTKPLAGIKANALDFSGWPSAPSPGPLEAWHELRRRKRAPVTQVVIDRMGEELHKAAKLGWSVDEALRESALRGWQGFNASWLPPKENPAGQGGADDTPTGRPDYAQGRQAGNPSPRGGGAIDRVLANARARAQRNGA